MNAVAFKENAILSDTELVLKVLLLLDPDVATMGSSIFPILRQKMEEMGWSQNRFFLAVKELRLSGRLFLSCSRKTVSLKPISAVVRKKRPVKGQKCVYCGTKAKKITRDHVIPKSKGGESTPENMVWACLVCNFAKADRTPEEWAADILAYRQNANSTR